MHKNTIHRQISLLTEHLLVLEKQISSSWSDSEASLFYLPLVVFSQQVEDLGGHLVLSKLVRILLDKMVKNFNER